MNTKYVTICCIVLSLWLLPMISYGVAPKEEAQGPVQVEKIDAESTVLPDVAPPRKRLLVSWLHMLDAGEKDGSEESSVMAFGPKVPGDLARILVVAGGNSGFWGVVLVLFKAVISIALGFLLSFAIKKIFRARLDGLNHLVPPDGGGRSNFVAGLLRSLPDFALLFSLVICSTTSFLLMAGGITPEGRMLYQMMLGVVLIYMLFQVVGEVIFAPSDKNIRLFSIDDSLVKPLHSAFSITFTVLASALLVGRCCYELGAQPQTVAWIAIILGTLILTVMAGLIVFLKKPVSQYYTKEAAESGGWMVQQFAVYWHLPALLYVAIVWIAWVGQKFAGTVVQSGSFIGSVLVVPLYFVSSYFAKNLIGAVVASLGLGKIRVGDEEDEPAGEEDVEEKNKLLAGRAYSFFRVFLIFILFAWVANLWGYDLPFAKQAMKAVFESFVTVGLALMCWRSASAYFESKMVDPAEDDADESKDIDDEFGGAVQRGRSHTLLPLLRKVIGSTLVLMVGLIIISSLGVNIGPLLAGAGVLGLAIGFGAQKLVSDVLSGFFFLFDDAFRVGEYIQAGKIRGTVESITLRNVLLRHHLGMLQVVPYSDLGAITNYMRGGIVIKFPLEFPYDTDIDKVRKIIKKVGQAMLLDEELGDGFLQPVKSQGVYEITNSVMVIRVKFTAKPGQQFLIKREAFRRITEALNAKGIYYAHRKVIVDFPNDTPKVAMDEESRKKALEAGAAAVVSEASLAPKEEQEEKVP